MKKNKLFLISLLLPFAVFSQTLTSISPSGADTGQTLDVIINGDNTHFELGTTVYFGIFTIDHLSVDVVNSVTVLSPTSLKVNITVPSNIVTDTYGVSVKILNTEINFQGGGFHVNGLPSPPRIDISNAWEIVARKTMDITIKGYKTHFTDPNGTNNTKVVFKLYNSSIPLTGVMNSMSIINDSTIVVNITTPGKANALSVYVSNDTDGELTTAFKVYPNCSGDFTTSYNVTTNAFTLELDSITSLGTNFFWNFGDGTSSSDRNPTHTYAKDTVYWVHLYVGNTQADSCEYVHPIGIDENGDPILITTGISSLEHVASLKVYPNPASDFITIETAKISVTNKQVLSICSIEGKLILQESFVKEKMDLDVSGFKKGVYIIQVTGNNKTEIIKFIKE